MKQGKYGIGITNILWNIVSSIIVLLFGVSYFNEKINKIQVIGIVFGIISLYLIDYKK
jgi:multidrug transporter EmrE-like cation transporter